VGELFERPRLYYVGDPNLTAYSVSIDVCTYSREDGYGRRTTERRAAHARSQPTSGGGFLLRSFSLRFCTGLRLRAPRCLRTGRLSTYSPSNEPSKSQCCELFFEVLRCRRGHQEKKRTQHDLFTALFRFASPCDGNWMPSVWRTPQSVSIDAELEAVASLNNWFFLVIQSNNRS
jgi:hypothetical protein